jgi:hypothetical protein
MSISISDCCFFEENSWTETQWWEKTIKGTCGINSNAKYEIMIN